MEEMAAFFARRVEEYDRHMREEVEGCREGYERMAQLLPGTLSRLLDLGCGTGLELETIFARFPQLEVTAIDLSNAMLQKARAKFPGRRLRLIQGIIFGRILARGSMTRRYLFSDTAPF